MSGKASPNVENAIWY